MTISNRDRLGTARDALLVEVSDLQSGLKIDTEALRDLVRRVLEGQGVRDATISLALVDDPAIHALNRRHLGHDWPTDVITFRLSGPSEPTLGGELIVSAEMAARTAREAGVEPEAELALYVVHGLLHLCGYDDQTDDQAAAMRRRESEVMAAEGLVNPFSMVGGAGPGRGSERCSA